MKFAHLADSHLGGWRQPELQELNSESFKIAINICIQEKLDFILFSGDLFDSAFPSIMVLKETFAEFRKLKDAGIKIYLIAGSHDYSVSGKTFLDVLEKAGFCEICEYEEVADEIFLKPIIHDSCYIYGYPGKKAGIEVKEIKRIKIKEPYEDHFRILMLHTTIKDVVGTLPIDSVNLNELPKADYYALGHIHMDFEKEINNIPVIYGGPLFPNNFKELEELKFGSFYIVDVEGYTKITKKEIKLKGVENIKIKLENALIGTEKIILELEKRDLKDKIVLLRIFGDLIKGKTSDIKFQKIELYLEKAGAYCFLKNTSKLKNQERELKIEIPEKEMEKVEEILIERYEKENPSDLNKLIPSLINSLNLEKQEGEQTKIFESRLLAELNKILGINLFN